MLWYPHIVCGVMMMVFFQAIWYAFAITVACVGCYVVGKELSKNYTADGNKFMTGFTYVAVYGIFAVGVFVFLKTHWFT